MEIGLAERGVASIKERRQRKAGGFPQCAAAEPRHRVWVFVGTVVECRVATA